MAELVRIGLTDEASAGKVAARCAAAFKAVSTMPSYARAEILRKAADTLDARAGEFARLV